MGNDNAYVKHILEAIAAIEEFTHGYDREKFLDVASKLVQAGVVREFEIIGEAVGKLSEKTRQRHPDLPWRDIVGMRNKLIHDYFSVNLNVVWSTIERDLPILKRAMQTLDQEVSVN